MPRSPTSSSELPSSQSGSIFPNCSSLAAFRFHIIRSNDQPTKFSQLRYNGLLSIEITDQIRDILKGVDLGHKNPVKAAAKVIAANYRSGALSSCPAPSAKDADGNLSWHGAVFEIPRSEWPDLGPGEPWIGVVIRAHRCKGGRCASGAPREWEVILPLDTDTRTYTYTEERLAEFMAGGRTIGEPLEEGEIPALADPTAASPRGAPTPRSTSQQADDPSCALERITIFGLGAKASQSSQSIVKLVRQFGTVMLGLDLGSEIQLVKLIHKRNPMPDRSADIVVLDVPALVQQKIWETKAKLGKHVPVSIDFYRPPEAHFQRQTQKTWLKEMETKGCFFPTVFNSFWRGYGRQAHYARKTQWPKPLPAARVSAAAAGPQRPAGGDGARSVSRPQSVSGCCRNGVQQRKLGGKKLESRPQHMSRPALAKTSKLRATAACFKPRTAANSAVTASRSKVQDCTGNTTGNAVRGEAQQHESPLPAAAARVSAAAAGPQRPAGGDDAGTSASRSEHSQQRQ